MVIFSYFAYNSIKNLLKIANYALLYTYFKPQAIFTFELLQIDKGRVIILRSITIE